jgi:hypothetical protein
LLAVAAIGATGYALNKGLDLQDRWWMSVEGTATRAWEYGKQEGYVPR